MIVALTSLCIAAIVLPGAYLVLCYRLNTQKAWWFTYLAYYCLFGTLGGWLFAFSMSPSGLAATSIVFLLTAALGACIACSVILATRPQKSRAEKIAMIGGFAYPGALVLMFFIGFLLRWASG